jgi:RNA methyltransferase, TrmH family
MTRIVSRQNPLVGRFRAAARNEDPGVVLLDGAHLVAEAVAARIAVEHAIVSSAALSDAAMAELIRALEDRGARISSAPAAVMDAVSPVRSASPIVALGARPADARAGLFTRSDALVVIACGVQDPGNVGAIARVAEAAGASAFVAAGPSADPFGWKALRGSMGSALRLPIAIEPDAAFVVADAKRHGCRLVATVPAGGQRLFDTDLRGAIAILIGSEGAGLPQELVDAAETKITIPMAPPVESLNAAVSAALILYEAVRQRR